MAVGIGNVLKAIFDDDTVSEDPAQWVALYPSRYPTTADVPEWFYKSLKDFIASSETVNQYRARVNVCYGEDMTIEGNGIAVASRISESAMSMEDENDTPGAETAVVQIKVQIRQSITMTPDMVEKTHLRIKQLLDNLTRQEMGNYGIIDWAYVAADQSIDSVPSDDNPGVYFRWRQHRDLNNALQQVAIYSAHYKRLFLRGS